MALSRAAGTAHPRPFDAHRVSSAHWSVRVTLAALRAAAASPPALPCGAPEVGHRDVEKHAATDDRPALPAHRGNDRQDQAPGERRNQPVQARKRRLAKPLEQQKRRNRRVERRYHQPPSGKPTAHGEAVDTRTVITLIDSSIAPLPGSSLPVRATTCNPPSLRAAHTSRPPRVTGSGSAALMDDPRQTDDLRRRCE
jgi:hypothetical protein